MLALHGAQTVGGAQFYIGCAQLKITGTGSDGACGPTIKLPGAYNAEDPNIYIPNVYNGFDVTSYTAPGGPVGSCDGSGGSTAPVSSKPASNSSAPATSAAAAASSAAIISSAPVASAPAATAAPGGNNTASALPSLVFPSTFQTSFVAAPTTNGNAPAAPSSTGSTGTVKKYGQCGGKTYAGATSCESGSTCTAMNDYYSQCV
jgi:cellulase